MVKSKIILNTTSLLLELSKAELIICLVSTSNNSNENRYIVIIDFSDITASDFVDAQMDLTFRKKWDTNVEKLELVRKDDDTDSELIHWVSKFPYPLYPREYVFVRRRYE